MYIGLDLRNRDLIKLLILVSGELETVSVIQLLCAE